MVRRWWALEFHTQNMSLVKKYFESFPLDNPRDLKNAKIFSSDLDNPECEDYKELNYYRSTKDAGKPNNIRFLCDRLGKSPDWRGEGWYRFTGAPLLEPILFVGGGYSAPLPVALICYNSQKRRRCLQMTWIKSVSWEYS